MKIHAPFLALLALEGAYSFQGPQPKKFQTTLASDPPPPQYSPSGTGTGTGAKTGGPASSVPGGLDSPRRVTSASAAEKASANVWDTLNPVTVQGGSLRTWSFSSMAVERVQVLMKTEGRPLNANIDLWQGPDNTPQKMRVYIEDGNLRPFSAVVETPRGPNAIAIRNTGQMEFPLSACVEADIDEGGLASVVQKLADAVAPQTIQGGSLKTYSFDPSVSSVQILLKTDGRPLNARLELLQGPNNNKQVIELYTEDGLTRPFFAVIETPGSGNVVRVLNTAPVEFPMNARVEPYLVETVTSKNAIVSDGGSGWDSGAPF